MFGPAGEERLIERTTGAIVSIDVCSTPVYATGMRLPNVYCPAPVPFGVSTGLVTPAPAIVSVSPATVGGTGFPAFTIKVVVELGTTLMVSPVEALGVLRVRLATPLYATLPPGPKSVSPDAAPTEVGVT